MSATTRTAAEQGLHIDWTRCDGHGLCAALLPEHIGRDEWGFPILPAAGVAIEPRVLAQVVHACPALALRIEPAPKPPRSRTR
ncbi:MAG TPA: ferredoxin [Jatrophihabitantaceae bacterium]|jgi:ferredoxin